jgi:hypothetical protein
MAAKVGLTPTINNFPKVMQLAGDAGTTALANKMDYWINLVTAEILAMQAFMRPEQAAAVVLPELVYMFNAATQLMMSDAQVRQAIASAVKAQKKRGEWAASVKPVIDAITGFSASIWLGLTADWPVRVGDQTFLGYGWSVRGAGVNANWMGIIRTGSGSEPIIPGNIYVDVGTSTLTPAQVAQIVQAIATDFVPAYFRVFLGYTTAGAFTVYAGGTIG